ncbi:dTDP-6-deoxy-3,4-keto-hexulose isomerase [Paenibacillus sp. FSL A5-0031]|uniref:sugar 3,4-ketoisomerase n=1 Tax=Paenibacillus sp. FSL A5-0031 TaxID=1920420 RepID=UPI00096CF333|nr:FdtA/QdtA family cupin domain-containing protein [Paenibacillus sp. FSL A5-0031]OME80593.1 dTDP-6-deoxy-3,4-keto-hexulose isomerase [Paenibacillus sp. FSL A5-0031]
MNNKNTKEYFESRVIELNVLGDERGSLTVIEENHTIPFEIKRVFYIYGTQNEVRRGFHGHYKTRQALISVSGSCKVHLDNLKRKKEVVLDSPERILLLEPNDWHEMYDFSKDCVLLVLASHYYDPKDYIRDYELFSEVYSSWC